jgi:hypothetical protein
LHKDAVSTIRERVFDLLGPSVVRVGRAPKELLVYRGVPGMSKLTSQAFTRYGDPIMQRLEILGKGQQFVALGIHQITREPYTYPEFTQAGRRFDADGLLSWMVEDLPEITPAQAEHIVLSLPNWLKDFPELTPHAGKTSRTRQMKLTKAGQDADGVVEFDIDSEPCDNITLENALSYLDWYAESPGYDNWVCVGMALHHQFGGSDEAFNLWDEWSATQPSYVGTEDLRPHWESFKNKANASVTFRTIIAKQKEFLAANGEISAAIAAERDASIARLLEETTGVRELLESSIPKIAKLIDRSDSVGIRLAKSAIQKTLKRVGADSPVKLTDKELTRMLMPRDTGISTDPKHLTVEYWDKRTPEWARGWVFVATEDVMVHRSRSGHVKRTAFDAMMLGHVAASDDSQAVGSASNYLLSAKLIPCVHRQHYWPGKPWLFLGGLNDQELCVNTFNPESITAPLAVGEPMTAEEKDAVLRIKRHLSFLVSGNFEAEDREILLLTSFLRHCYEFPGKKIRWAPLLQSSPRAGKSFLHELLGVLLGECNVKPINCNVILRSADTSFNDWAFGACVASIEELRMHGHNRFDVLNSLKAPITNNTIQIHPKGGSTYPAHNVQNYIAFTNFVDALPLDHEDGRWFVLLCKGSHGEALLHDPEYYDRLFDALHANGPAIGRWLLDQPYHEEFDPDGNAPVTAGRDIMIAVSGDAEGAYGTADIIEESKNCLVGPHVVVPSEILKELRRRALEAGLPITNGLAAVSNRGVRQDLSELGYVPMRDKIRLTNDQGLQVRVRPWIRRSATEAITDLDWWVRARVAEQAASVRDLTDDWL